MINERYREDRERRRLGSLTVYSGPTHSGKTKKLEAEAERAQRQGRRMQRLAAAADPNALLSQLDPAAELLTVDDAQQYDDRLVEVLELRGHPWFVAVQCHPEFKSKPTQAHPLFREFVRASLGKREGKAPAAPRRRCPTCSVPPISH